MTEENSAISWVTESLPAMEVGEEYAEWLQVTGGTPPYSFRVTEGQPPAGIDVTAMGTVNGVPTEAGDATFSVTVTDSAGATSTQAFDAQVSAQPGSNG
jgi:large repetitive protein